MFMAGDIEVHGSNMSSSHRDVEHLLYVEHLTVNKRTDNYFSRMHNVPSFLLMLWLVL